MSIGEAWGEMMGTQDKDQSFKLLDYFFDNGGNFIDTANNYQEGESERWLGEWMAKRDIRSQVVLATKFTTGFRKGDGPLVNFVGNSVKNLRESVTTSLKNLQTDYIDLLYVHWWDYTMSIPELMQALDALVRQGTVLALGISDTPAWIVAKANEYARSHGLRQFSVYQGRWNVTNRDLERDVVPMCSVLNNGEAMAICPWDVLGGGRYKTDEQIEQQKQSGDKGRNMPGFGSEKDKKAADVLDKIAKRHNSNVTGIALSYIINKTPYVFPIVGGRKIEHLQGNIDALKIQLTAEDIKEIEDAVPFELGFPHDFLGGSTPGNNWLMKSVAYMDHVDGLKAIKL